MLKQFLLQHVLKGHHSINALAQGWTGKALDGSRLHTYLTKTGHVSIGDSKIVDGDINNESILIHILDKVLLPTTNFLGQVIHYTATFIHSKSKVFFSAVRAFFSKIWGHPAHTA